MRLLQAHGSSQNQNKQNQRTKCPKWCFYQRNTNNQISLKLGKSPYQQWENISEQSDLPS
jgi:hypothetical protein